MYEYLHYTEKEALQIILVRPQAFINHGNAV